MQTISDQLGDNQYTIETVDIETEHGQAVNVDPIVMQKFIYPSPQWLKKHGNVYCSNCGDRTNIAMIPVVKKSVIFRREHASCKVCVEIVSRKIDRWLKINYTPDYSDAAFSIGHIYG